MNCSSSFTAFSARPSPRTRTPLIANCSSGAFCSTSFTWNSGARDRSRSGCNSSTNFSNGTSWCSYAPNVVSRTRPSNSRKLSSHFTSVRSTNWFMKNPINPSVSSRFRLASSVRTATSRSPLRRPAPPHPVHRQLQLLQPFQLPPPVSQLLFQHRPLQPLPLPYRKIRILHRQLRQLRSPPPAIPLVQLPELPHQNPHRPPIAHHVMRRHQQHLLVRAHPHQPGSQQPPAAQLERPPRFPPRQLRRRLAGPLSQPAHIQHRQRHFPLRLDPLYRLALPLLEPRPQHLVPPHDPAQRRCYRAHLQRPLHPRRERHIVGRALRLQLMHEPQAPLGERQRQR